MKQMPASAEMMMIEELHKHARNGFSEVIDEANDVAVQCYNTHHLDQRHNVRMHVYTTGVSCYEIFGDIADTNDVLSMCGLAKELGRKLAEWIKQKEQADDK